MDTPAPGILDDGDLFRVLSASWALEADELRYVPKGAGSYHWIALSAGDQTYFITVDDLDSKPWLGERRDRAFEGLGAAYEAAWALQHEVGLPFVTGPMRGPGGTTLARLSDQFSMAVFPFVVGHAGSWGDPLNDWDRTELLRVLAKLHQTTPPLGVRVARRPLDIPERPCLKTALSDVEHPWEGGPLSESARCALADHAQGVTGWLDQLDGLAKRLGDEDSAEVLTHGEPHPGNLIRSAGGLGLIDWDTIALALPERDLWMLDNRSDNGFALYEDLTGKHINEAAISFYRLAWSLSDIASLARIFRAPHDETEWIRRKWKTFQLLLRGAPSAPFAMASQGLD